MADASRKKSRTDGLNPCFYQKVWLVVGDEVVQACSSWTESGIFRSH